MRRIVLIALLVATVATTTASSAPSHYPAENGWIVFASNRDTLTAGPGHRLYRLDPVGGRVTRLRSLAGSEPVWSPDGTQIAFVNGRGRLVIANAEGTAAKLLTRDLNTVGAPSFSPDGSRIVFQHLSSGRGGVDLAIVNADGRNVRPLTRTPHADYDPAWSPDGSRIAFASNRDSLQRGSITEIYVVRVDGRDLRRLTRNTFVDDDPAWSPDGSLIAFASMREPGRFNPELWTIGGDGRGERRVQRAVDPSGGPSWADHSPSWSPDGNWLVYVTNQTNFSENVFIVRPDGQDKIDLTPESGSRDVDPAWQPVCSHPGTQGSDRLQGTAVDDRVCGFAGNDTIKGGTGRDGLYGGKGDDSLRARDGLFDIVGCGGGRDEVVGDRVDLVGVDCEDVKRS